MNTKTRLDDKLNAVLVGLAVTLAVGLNVNVLTGASLSRGEPQAQQMAKAKTPEAAPTALVAALQVAPLPR